MGFGLILLALGVAIGLLMINHDAGEIFGIGSGDFARMTVLAIFTVTIGAALLRSYRGRLGDMLSSAVLWLALFVVLVGGYGYRSELETFGRRTFGVLVPGLAVDTGEPGTVMISKSRDGHFRVRASVNGRPIRLVVDTGASSVVLSDRDARESGIEIGRLNYDVKVSTANGSTTAAPVVLDTLQVGEITERRVAALVARPGQLETSLLGNSFLDRLASFTIEGERLILKR